VAPLAFGVEVRRFHYAWIVAAAERLGVGTIATLDRRHFTVVRPAHKNAFELVP